MAFAYVAIKDTTYGGVYYSANFTTSGAITWTKLTTTGLASLAIVDFKVDPFDPANRQYVIAANVLYTRNAGNWSSIMTLAAAQTLTSAANIGANRTISNAWTDPTAEGTIYCVYYSNSGVSQSEFILKSTDYGANWSVQWAPYDSVGGGPSELRVYGNTIWYSHDKNYPPNPVFDYTANGGGAYNRTNFVMASQGFQVNYPWDTTQAYSVPPASVGTSDLYVWDYGETPDYSKLQDNLADGLSDSGAGNKLWVSPILSGHQRIARLSGGKFYIHYTTNGWSTYSSTEFSVAGGVFIKPFQATHIQNTGNTTAVIVGISTGAAAGVYRSCIYALDSETDTSAALRNGANSETTYVDSVPSNLLLADRTPIWVGEQPVSTGIYVYSVEMEASDAGWATDVTDYAKIGSPMGGDRASFRDMPADGFDKYHAQDVHAGTPQIHAPWDSASPPGAGYGIVSDGSKWEVSSAPLATTSSLHNAVTLDADAATILDLSTQEIGLDVQNANTVFAGPTSAPANEPTFRALELSDLPAIELDDLDDVDTAGVGTGDIIYKSSGDWVDYPLGIGTNVVNEDDRLKLGDVPGGNYVQIDLTTGDLLLIGTAGAWEDLRVEPTVRAAAGAGVPAFEKYFDDLAGTSKGVYLYSFTDEAVAGNEKEVFFSMQMPHAWRVGTSISFHVHFVPAATVNSSDIVWGLEYTWKGIGEVFGDTTIIYSSTTLLPDDANITAGKHYLAEFTDIAPGTTASSVSSILIGRLFRNSSSGSDTYTDKVGLLYIDGHYQVDSFGSFDEYDKPYDDNMLLETGDFLLLETGDNLLLD